MFNGSSPETNLPTAFSPTENIAWVADLPGPAAATPVIGGDYVFISSGDAQRQSLVALCFDRRTGRPLWRHEVSSAYRQDHRVNYASPSPVTDGRLVIFFFGSGEVAAFEVGGRKLWARNLQKDYGPFAFLWTFSSSPTLYNNRLYHQVLQRDVPVSGRGRAEGNDSYLLALEPQTGRELWRHIRPSDARQESREAFSTPLPFTHAGRTELLVTGGDCISGHDPETGRELWRWGTWNPTRIGHWRLVVSPVAGGGVALACAPKGSPVYAVKLGERGDLGEAGLAWKSEPREASSDVSTPLFYKGRFFVVNSDRHTIACLDPATGQVFWTGHLESRAKLEASPTGADNRIYVMNFRGDVFIVGTGDKFELLKTIPMGDEEDREVRSSVAVSQGQLFIRTTRKLYCVGQSR
jgi:outer membrane protein assembly factor BamB